jgi:dolichyl-phosphate beta-glucosyltransferase
MSNPSLDISVVIPAFCEEEGIAATVSAVHSHMLAAGKSFEIIVIDNASPDGTADAVRRLGLDGLIVLVNESNRGKGYSVRRGMSQARGKLRLHCDADCSPSLPSLEQMEALIRDGSDVVVGSRLASGAEIGQRQPLLRRIMGSSFQNLCRLILSEPTRDRFCGFKLWTADASDAVFPKVSLDGWTFDAEALALARRLGYSVTETGIAWSDREGSRLSMIKILIPVTLELLAARRNVRSIPREPSRPNAAN